MLHTDYCNFNFSNPDRDCIDRPHGTKDYLFLYFQTPMKIRIEGTLHIVKPGACILIPPNTPTYYQAVEHFQNSFVHFTGEDVEPVMHHFSNLKFNSIFYLPDVDYVNQIVQDIFAEYVSRDYLYAERIDNLIHHLLITISRQLGTYENVSRESLDLYDIFQKARLTILTHLEKPWTAESMAKLTNLGNSQFYNYYKDFFKRSPKAELLDARIDRAKYLLIHESFSVAAVAEYCGFSNLSHFTRFFKKKCGTSPCAYRKMHLQ